MRLHVTERFNKVSVRPAERKSVTFHESGFNKQSLGCKRANKIHNYFISDNKG